MSCHKIRQASRSPLPATQRALQLAILAASAGLTPALLAQTLELQGLDPLYVEQNADLDALEPGFTALDASGNPLPEGQVQVQRPATDTLGSFTATYTLNDASGNPLASVDRGIEVVGVDELPTATLQQAGQPLAVALNASQSDYNDYFDPGIVVSDIQDAPAQPTVLRDFSELDTSAVGAGRVRYTVTDSDGNRVQVVREIAVVNAPVITLNGDNPSRAALAGGVNNYSELGATATDVEDDPTGSLQAIVVSSGPLTPEPPASAPNGGFAASSIRYDASDADGNAAIPVFRSVQFFNGPDISVNLVGGARDIQIGVGDRYATSDDAGATASDLEDGAVTVSTAFFDPDDNPAVDASGNPEIITKPNNDDPQAPGYVIPLGQPQQFTVVYTASDGDTPPNTFTARRVVTVTNTAPAVTLNGPNPRFVRQNTFFEDQPLPVTVSDPEDDAAGRTVIVETDISGVDTSVLGSAQVFYRVTDTHGNRVTVSREIRVIADDDGDTIANSIENSFGNAEFNNGDSDGDGEPNRLDFDSDNDGLSDELEVGPNPAEPRDTDGDGLPDFVDRDSDNDRILDKVEARGSAELEGCDPLAPDQLDYPVDSDCDGVPDYRDRDSDGDLIIDFAENNRVVPVSSQHLPSLDRNANGFEDFLEPSGVGGTGTDSDGNGVDDRFDAADVDGDGIPNYRDWDSDGGRRADISRDQLPFTTVVGSDSYEQSLPLPEDSSDDDGDGLTDNDPFVDVDPRDGLDDRIADAGLMNIDTASGGVPNSRGMFNFNAFRDFDCDGSPSFIGLVQVDVDCDGLANYLDSDSDGDGLADSLEMRTADNAAVAAVDTDGDGIEDYLDLDSDNDLLLDAREALPANDLLPLDMDTAAPDFSGDGFVDDPAEQGSFTALDAANGPAPVDSDSDGLPDFRDLESNNPANDGSGAFDIDSFNTLADSSPRDGVSDATQLNPAPSPGPDEDGDGVAADFTPSGGSLIPGRDQRDGYGAFDGVDTDRDGIIDADDLDDDNDGIADLVEDATGNGDTDADGLANSIDLDSDNDGISDLVESGYLELALGGQGDTVADANADGRLDLDVWLDAVIDGQHDLLVVEEPRDFDGDGVADYLDRDSDGDGQFDLVEGLLQPALLALLDSRTDISSAGSVDYSFYPAGQAAMLDASLYNADLDLDNNGFLDRLQSGPVNGVVETGGGGGALGGLPFLTLLFTALHKVMQKKRRSVLLSSALVAALALLGSGSVAAASDDCATLASYGEPFTASFTQRFKSCLYAGLGVGLSRLTPEQQDALGFSLDDDYDLGYAATLGYRLNRRLYAELSYQELGAASLKTNFAPLAGQSAEIDYSALSLAAGYYLFAGDDGFDVSVELAVLQLDTAASGAVTISQQDDIFLGFGVGLDYRPNASPWFARLSFDYHSEDAQSLLFSINRYIGFGADRAANKYSSKSTERSAAADASADDAVKTLSASEPVVSTDPALASNTPAAIESADDEAVESTLDALQRDRDCELLDSAIAGLNFASGSAELEPTADAVLSRYAEALLRNSDLLIEIGAHTDNSGSQAANAELSQQRAEAVSAWLQARGVEDSQLLVRGYAASRPIADNNSVDGRAANRRVEFRVMNLGRCL